MTMASGYAWSISTPTATARPAIRTANRPRRADLSLQLGRSTAVIPWLSSAHVADDHDAAVVVAAMAELRDDAVGEAIGVQVLVGPDEAGQFIEGLADVGAVAALDHAIGDEDKPGTARDHGHVGRARRHDG